MPRLSTIIGHDAVVRRIQRAIAHQEVGHAYLFAGPRGVGKTTTARALAKALNCLTSAGLLDENADSCEICTSCLQADAGVHPDIHLVRPPLTASEAAGSDRKPSVEIGIDQIRELLHQVGLTPSTGRRKVFIVSPADAMNERSQNALLKGLEEPPPYSTLILCAESPGSVLETVQSRCQVLGFGLAPREQISRRLRELFGLSPEEAQIAASLSQGRVGRAIRYAGDPAWKKARHDLLDGILSLFTRTPLEALMAAGPLRETALKVPLTIERRGTGAAEAVVDRLAGRLQTEMLLEEMAMVVRDLLVLVGSGESQPETDCADLVVNRDRLDEMASIAEGRQSPGLLAALESVLTAQDLLRRNVNPQLLLEDLALELAGMPA